jgi:selenocysteine lyase/cysteine desulfurase
MRDITQKLDGRRIALAVIDHIVSTTAIVVPVKRVIEMMRSVTTSAFSLLRVVDIAFFVPFIHVFDFLQHGVQRVMVDGAHAPGSIPLDIPSIGADYYVGNIHKCTCTFHPMVTSEASCCFRDVCSCGMCNSARFFG